MHIREGMERDEDLACINWEAGLFFTALHFQERVCNSLSLSLSLSSH